MTSASSSSSSTDRRFPEPKVVSNAVVIKEEPIDEDSYEVYPSTSIDISPEAAADAQVKLEEMFDWSDKENDTEDEHSY